MTDNITFDEYEQLAFDNAKPKTQGHRLSLHLQAAYNYSAAKELRSGNVISSKEQMLGIANGAAAMMAMMAKDFQDPNLVAFCCDKLTEIIEENFDDLIASLVSHGHLEVSN